MKQFILIFTFLFLSIFLEASVTTIPFTLCLLLVFYVLTRSPLIFLAAFLAGLVLDISLVRQAGQTSIFFLAFLFIANLYERKFEISNGYFILFYSFIGSFVFLIIQNYENILLQSIVSAIFSVILFKIIKQLSKKEEE